MYKVFYKLKFKSNLIWLTRNPALYNYTFLESNLMQRKHLFVQDKQSRPFLNQFNKIRDEIKQLNNRDYTQMDIIKSQQLISVATSYEKMKKNLKQGMNLKLYDDKKCKQILNNIVDYNVVDIDIWSKIFLQFFEDYDRISQNNQNHLFILNILNQYMNKFHLSNTSYGRFKFVIDESMINKLCYFKNSLQILYKNKKIVKNYADIEHSEYNMLSRVKKIINIDLNIVQEYFLKNFEFIKNSLKQYNDQKILNLYEIYSDLCIDQTDIIKYFQDQIIMRKSKIQINSEFIKKIFNIWKIQGRYNPVIYDFIKNKLYEIIQAEKYPEFKITIFYAMASARIKDTQLINYVYSKIINHNIKEHMHLKNLHIAQHIFSIRNQLDENLKRKNQNKFRYCCKQQNFEILKLLNENSKIKLQSECIQPNQSLNKMDLYAPQNKIQQFFYKSIKQLYHGSPIKILRNIFFCSFEIDIFLIINNIFYALEVFGSHYMQKSSQMFTGKKSLKKEILNNYNIKVIDINCTEPEVILMMQNKDYKSAGEYLQNKIKQQ